MSNSSKTILDTINIVFALSISLGALYFIIEDFKTSRFILNNSYSKLFAIFFIFFIIASIINGNGFQRFNNIYFVIHSALFFYLMMLNNYNYNDYLNKINFTILIILIGIFLVSLITILIFFSNFLGITTSIKSENIREFFNFVAPIDGRWYTIVLNPNIYSYLVSMTFFLTLIPFVTIKNIRIKSLISFVQLINLICVIFSGSKGALLSILTGLLIVFVYFISHFLKNKKFLHIFTLFLIIFSIIILLFVSLKSNKLNSFFKIQILRLGKIKNGSGRFEIWTTLFKLPLFSKIFGYSDNYIFNFMSKFNLSEFRVFSSNQGRAHNIFIEALVSFGSVGFFLFILCLYITFIKSKENYIKINNQIKFLLRIFILQFIVILVGGLFEQLALFSLSPHSLIFMLVWANILIIIDKKIVYRKNCINNGIC